MAKVKVETLLQAIAGDAVKDALKTAKPKYKDKTNAELAEIFGLSEFQFEHFMEKALGRSISQKLEGAFKNTLANGDSIEVPHQFNVFVHESQVRKNENGTPVRKLSIRTRKSIKETIN